MTYFPEKPAHGHPLVGTRLGVIGREGAGRTTLAVLLARELAGREYEVCFLDADSRAPGPHLAFGMEAPPGSLLEFFRASNGWAEEEGEGDVGSGRRLDVSLRDLPESVLGRTGEGICVLSLGKSGGGPRDEGCDRDVARIARDLRVSGHHEKPLTLIELEASPLASPADLLAGLDWVLVVVDPTFASVELAAEVRERALGGGTPSGDPSNSGPASEGGMAEGGGLKGVTVVLNHVPDPETEQFFATAVAQQALLDTIGAIREDWDVSEAGVRGQSVPEHKAELRVRKIVDQIEEAQGRPLSEAMA